MNYTSETHPILIDVVLEVMSLDEPVQLRVTEEDGTSAYFVGRIDGAMRGAGSGVVNIHIGETVARVTSEHTWEIAAYEEGIRGLTPTEVFVDELIETMRKPIAAAPTAGMPTVHALRWSQGQPIGFHDATILRRLTEDSVLVRFGLDGHEAGVFLIEIRATESQWKAITALPIR